MYTNDPDESTVSLKLFADIVAIFDFEKLIINIGKITRTDRKEATYIGIGEKLSEAEILAITVEDTSHSAYYETEIVDTGKNGKASLNLVVKPVAEIPVGRFKDRFIVETNIPENPRLELYIKGEMLGPVEAQPRGCVLRYHPEEAFFIDTVRIVPTGGRKFKVTSAACEDDRVKTTIATPAADGSIEIELAVPRDFPEERLRTDLKVKTDLPEQPEITVPVNGFFKR